ncbi:MAG: hypothetical protein C0608_11660 [Deltaproteobacteria bacterium]|nr:MAG: hypothetical protein C0608_11660 [Deltaproteobacteria bacterium]
MLRSLKPAGSASVQLFLAALLWSSIGTFLLYRGARAALSLTPAMMVLVIAVALAIGLFKGYRVMRPVSTRSITRIIERGDGTCIGGFLSWKSWLFVLGMSLMGKWLRSASLPPWLTGVLLGGVGLALLVGSLFFWRAWVYRLWG